MKNTNSIRQIFISYTDQGKDDALRLTEMIGDKIKKTHAIVWEWRDQIPGGAAIREKYTKELQVSDLFIPVITTNYKDRPGTQDELIKAGERQSYLRTLYGNDYNFIIPFIGNQEPDLLQATHPDLDGKLARRTYDEVINDVNEYLRKIEQSLAKNSYSFRDWPSPFINENGEIDALVVIGHSGKEDIPEQAELGEFGRYITDIEATRHQPQSMRPAEYIPELIYFFNKESIKRQVAAGKGAAQIEPKLLDVFVDWHLLKHFQSHISSKHLICLGAGDTNLISRWAMAHYQKFLPVHFDDANGSHTIIAKKDGKFESISLKQIEAGKERFAGILVLLPNPLNEKKVILIAAGLTGLGTQAAMLAISDPKNLINSDTGYSSYARIIKGIEEKWRAVGYEVIR